MIITGNVQPFIKNYRLNHYSSKQLTTCIIVLITGNIKKKQALSITEEWNVLLCNISEFHMLHQSEDCWCRLPVACGFVKKLRLEAVGETRDHTSLFRPD